MSESKWCCRSCTYQNWPAASACALCRSERPGATTAGVSSANDIGNDIDIYKLAICDKEPELEVGQSVEHQSASETLADSRKWSCEACTYLNWPKSQHCVQCLTPKPLSGAALVPDPEIQSQDLARGNGPESIGSSGTHELDANANVKRDLRRELEQEEQQHYNSSEQVEPEVRHDVVADHEKALVSETTNRIICGEEPESGGKTDADATPRVVLSKWTCRQCTFEVTSNAARCVICGSARPSKRVANCNTQPQSSSSAGNAGAECEQPAGSCASSSANSNTSSRISSRAQSPCATPSAGKKGQPTGRASLLVRPASGTKARAAASRSRVDGASAAAGAAAGASGRRLPCSASEHVDELNRLLLACVGVRNTVSVNIVRLRMPQGGGDFELPFPCYYIGIECSFTLPPSVYTMPFTLQSQLLRAVVDSEALAALEADAAINWSLELVDRLQSRLYALANRTSGDCLLDSALQATWGMCDRDAILRRLLCESLVSCSELFFAVWKRYELERQRRAGLPYSLSDAQWRADWRELLELAAKPGSSLEQLHVLALAHVLRRPVIVYSVRFVTGLRGDLLAASPFQGVYLPIFWDRAFCLRSPIALGYTRGHFSALVAIEPSLPPYVPSGGSAHHFASAASSTHRVRDEPPPACVYYPLVDRDGNLLPIHFATPSMASELPSPTNLDDGGAASVNAHADLATLCEWLDCVETPSGLLVARCRLQSRLAPVRDMCQSWLDSFRRPSDTIETSVRRAPRGSGLIPKEPAAGSPHYRKQSPPRPVTAADTHTDAPVMRSRVASLSEDDT